MVRDRVSHEQDSCHRPQFGYQCSPRFILWLQGLTMIILFLLHNVSCPFFYDVSCPLYWQFSFTFPFWGHHVPLWIVFLWGILLPSPWVAMFTNWLGLCWNSLNFILMCYKALHSVLLKWCLKALFGFQASLLAMLQHCSTRCLLKFSGFGARTSIDACLLKYTIYVWSEGEKRWVWNF